MPRKPKPLGFSLSELDVRDSLRRDASAEDTGDYDCKEVSDFVRLLQHWPPGQMRAPKANPPAPPPAPTSESCGRLVLAVKSANSDRMLDLSIPLCSKSVTTVSIGDIVEDVYTEDLLRAADTIRKHLDKSLLDKQLRAPECVRPFAPLPLPYNNFDWQHHQDSDRVAQEARRYFRRYDTKPYGVILGCEIAHRLLAADYASAPSMSSRTAGTYKSAHGLKFPLSRSVHPESVRAVDKAEYDSLVLLDTQSS